MVGGTGLEARLLTPARSELQVSLCIPGCGVHMALFSVNLCVCNGSDVSGTCGQIRHCSRLPGVKLLWSSLPTRQPAGFDCAALQQVSSDISRVVLSSVNFNGVSTCVFS